MKITATTIALSLVLGASARLDKRWANGRGDMTIDPNSHSALVAASKGIARAVISRYPNSPPGLFEVTHNSQTVNWWQNAIAWTGMFRHFATSGDYYGEFAAIDAMEHNEGAHFDYEPAWAGIENGEGNDDQAWWGIASLTAYEIYGNKSANTVDWLGNAINVQYMMSRYWANNSAEAATECGGGVRWQQDPGDGGWPYLNSITSGQYFLLNALLYQYTGEASYLAWAQDTYDWLKYTANLTTAYHVYDGITAPECTQGEGGSREFTYLSAALVGGTAVMYKVTGSNYWKEENTGFVKAVKEVYTNGSNIIVEPSCREEDGCYFPGLDRYVFKGILARELGRAYTIIPNNVSKSMIQDSVQGLVKNCDSDWECGYFWDSMDDNRNTTCFFAALELVNSALLVL